MENAPHKLYDKWALWAHLPHDTDWSLKSYIKITDLDTLENVISLNNILTSMNLSLFTFLTAFNVFVLLSLYRSTIPYPPLPNSFIYE